jgi:hypothetical protein
MIQNQRVGRLPKKKAYNLLDNLAGRVEVDETLVDLHLEAVPGL